MHVLVIIGTRPEAIKLAPVICRLQEYAGITVKVCLTGQHRELLAQGLADFHITPHHNLEVMREKQSLNTMVSRLLADLPAIFETERPDWVVVQGDTSSAMAAAMAAFHHGIRVAHVEAGLRTGNRAEPWPEEINRKVIGQLASLHFAPTQAAADNLRREGIASSDIVVSGNTVIDALTLALSMISQDGSLADGLPPLAAEKPLILCTLHRRENLTPDRLPQVESALTALAKEKGCQIVFPFHPNPSLKETVDRLRQADPHLHMISPLRYVPFVALMNQAHLILTDSGGIQEEAAFLGKPLLIMRASTERPEVLGSTARLVGTNQHAILAAASDILDNLTAHRRTTGAFSDLGSGSAAQTIVSHLLSRPEPFA